MSYPYRSRRRRRAWVALVLAAGAAAVLTVVLLPRPGPAALELVALDPAGRFTAELYVPAARVETVAARDGAAARAPLLLAVRNVGRRAARPERVELSVPARVRLLGPDRRPLPARTVPGSPLVRYELRARFPAVEPGRLPVLVPGLDTLWLELALPSLYCVALGDSVPEFMPAPAPDPATVSRIRIFYSFEGAEPDGRQAGLLTVQLDPAAVPRPPGADIPVFPAELREPEAPLPRMGWLRYGGSRRTACGDPEEPLELLATLWETPAGGRFLVLDYGGAPRKYLFDLDADGTVELEMWDPDGDGQFEARRAARLPLPAFLLPPPPAPAFDPGVLAALPAESLQRLDRFRGAGPYRPRGAGADAAASPDRFRPVFVLRERRDAAAAAPLAGARGAPPAFRPGAAPPPFAPSAPPAPGAAPATPAAPGPTGVGEPPADRPPAPAAAPGPMPAGLQPRRPAREIKLLGKPVDSLRPAPRDTSGRSR